MDKTAKPQGLALQAVINPTLTRQELYEGERRAAPLLMNIDNAIKQGRIAQAHIEVVRPTGLELATQSYAQTSALDLELERLDALGVLDKVGLLPSVVESSRKRAQERKEGVENAEFLGRLFGAKQ